MSCRGCFVSRGAHSPWLSAGQLTDLVFHDELHQLQPGLPRQAADPFLQSGGNLLQRQIQLDLAIPCSASC